MCLRASSRATSPVPGTTSSTCVRRRPLRARQLTRLRLRLQNAKNAAIIGIGLIFFSDKPSSWPRLAGMALSLAGMSAYPFCRERDGKAAAAAQHHSQAARDGTIGDASEVSGENDDDANEASGDASDANATGGATTRARRRRRPQ